MAVTRKIVLVLTALFAFMTLMGVGVLAFLSIDLIWNTLTRNMPLENRWFEIFVVLRLVTISSLLGELLAGLLTRWRWVPYSRGRMGVWLFGAISLLINFVGFLTMTTFYEGLTFCAIASIVFAIAFFCLKRENR